MRKARYVCPRLVPSAGKGELLIFKILIEEISEKVIGAKHRAQLIEASNKVKEL